MLSQPADFLVSEDRNAADEVERVTETKVVSYLYASFCKNESFFNENDCIHSENASRIRGLIMRNVGTAIKQPAFYDGQNLCEQMLSIFKDTSDDTELKAKFVSCMVKEVLTDDEAGGRQYLAAFFFPILIQIHGALRKVRGFFKVQH